jgi:hypothetical protein
MLDEGADVAPISLAAVARRLALGSRTTLYGPARLERIRAAKARQRKLSPGSKSGARLPRGDSQSDMQRLRHQLNELRGYIAQVAVNAHRMGLQPDLLLSLSQLELKTGDTLNPDRIVIQYLSDIGLLAKLDANVRGLAR